MKIGIIGLGRMGSGLAQRLLEGGHEVMAYNRHADKVAPIVAAGGIQATAYADFKNLPTPRVVWVMVPAGEAVDEVVFGPSGLTSVLEPGDIIVDGGNSHYTDTVKRSQKLADHKIILVDIGTSGGLGGRKNGYCLMVGGTKEAFDHIEPALKTIAQKDGYGFFGDSGAGHYTKMVHNAIEYGMMQSIAEGCALLMEGEFRDVSLAKAADVWQHGSIIQSYLVGLIENIFTDNPTLDGIPGIVNENGEARWTVEAAKRLGVELPSIELSLHVRADSQAGKVTNTTKILAALRNQFGGHSFEKE